MNLENVAWIGIHDGARPLVDAGLLDRLLQARTRGDAIIPSLAASDTIKQINPQGYVVATLDRKTVHGVQTPQLFRFRLILRAHQQAEACQWLGTDDASLVERLPHPVLAVPGSVGNIKITRPLDWILAERLLQEEKQ